MPACSDPPLPTDRCTHDVLQTVSDKHASHARIPLQTSVRSTQLHSTSAQPLSRPRWRVPWQPNALALALSYGNTFFVSKCHLYSATHSPSRQRLMPDVCALQPLRPHCSLFLAQILAQMRVRSICRQQHYAALGSEVSDCVDQCAGY